MKKLSIILAIVLIAPAAMAADVSVDVYTGFHSSVDTEYTVRSHRGVKATATLSDAKFAPYLWGSWDQMETRLVGLLGPQYDIAGAGVGLRYRFAKYVSVFADVGYFHPMVQNIQDVRITDDDGRNMPDPLRESEGVTHYLNNRFNGAIPWAMQGGIFDDVDVDASGSFGGEVGFRMDYPLADWVSLNITGAYRLMQVNETIYGYKDEWTAKEWWWEHKATRDFSGPRIGAGITITW